MEVQNGECMSLGLPCKAFFLISQQPTLCVWPLEQRPERNRALLGKP
uniref:Uncharacterized protein n=1 Tax=Anguilla anguilla TaxID=7936 RepID=A0A0E9TCH8_ANGAN